MRPTTWISLVLLAAGPAAFAEEPRGRASSGPPVEMSAPRDSLPPASPVEEAVEPPPPGLITMAMPRSSRDTATPLAGDLDELRWLLGRWVHGASRVTVRKGPGGRSLVLETAADRDGTGSFLDVIVPARGGDGMEVYTFSGEDAAPSVTSASLDERSFSFRRDDATVVFERSGSHAEPTSSGASTALRFRKDS